MSDIEDTQLMVVLADRLSRDNGNRHTMDAMMAALGFTRDELVGYPIQDRCGCGPQPDDRIRPHRRGGPGCRSSAP